MKPYRVPPPRSPSPVESSALDYGRFEQLCIYALLAFAAFALALTEIKIP